MVTREWIPRNLSEGALVQCAGVAGCRFLGPKLAEHRGALSLSYPMERGVVQDWDDMQRVWSFVFDGLGANVKEHPVRGPSCRAVLANFVSQTTWRRFFSPSPRLTQLAIVKSAPRCSLSDSMRRPCMSVCRSAA